MSTFFAYVTPVHVSTECAKSVSIEALNSSHWRSPWHCSHLPKLTTSDLCAIQKLALC